MTFAEAVYKLVASMFPFNCSDKIVFICKKSQICKNFTLSTSFTVTGYDHEEALISVHPADETAVLQTPVSVSHKISDFEHALTPKAPV
jgi:hypothetical protein